MDLQNSITWIGLISFGVLSNYLFYLLLKKITTKKKLVLLFLFLIPSLILLFSIYGVGGWEGMIIGIVVLGMFLYSILFIALLGFKTLLK